MTPQNNNAQKVMDGKWNDNLSWEFYLADKLPSKALCTAVYCLAIMWDTDQVVLTRIKRGWEMLGGHIEPEETLEDALVREAMEEGGFVPQFTSLYGYMKVTAKNPHTNDHHGGTYPPIAYIPYFLAVTRKPVETPTGEEIIESQSFDINYVANLNSAHEQMIQIGFDRYLKLKTSIQLA